MIEADHHPSLHVDFVKFLPKLASYVNYLFAVKLVTPIRLERAERAHVTPTIFGSTVGSPSDSLAS